MVTDADRGRRLVRDGRPAGSGALAGAHVAADGPVPSTGPTYDEWLAGPDAAALRSLFA